MPVKQEFDVALPRRRSERLVTARTHAVHRRRNPRARMGHRAVLKRQPLNLEAEDFGLASEDFQGGLLCADEAWSADQRFEEGEGRFGLRINGSIECFGHLAHWSMIRTICQCKDGAKAHGQFVFSRLIGPSA
jgi:hypothetical protein